MRGGKKSRQVCLFLYGVLTIFLLRSMCMIHIGVFLCQVSRGLSEELFFTFWLVLAYMNSDQNSEWETGKEKLQYLSVFYVHDTVPAGLFIPAAGCGVCETALSHSSCSQSAGQVNQWPPVNWVFLGFVCFSTLLTHFAVTYISIAFSSVSVVYFHTETKKKLLWYTLYIYLQHLLIMWFSVEQLC